MMMPSISYQEIFSKELLLISLRIILVNLSKLENTLRWECHSLSYASQSSVLLIVKSPL